MLLFYSFQIKSWLSLNQLLPVLRAQGLMNEDEREEALAKKTRCDRFQFLSKLLSSKGPEAFVKFYHCLKEERAREHIGHQYVVQLLEGKDVFGDELVMQSRNIQEAVRRNETAIHRLLKLSTLRPYLHRYELVTRDESETYLDTTQGVVMQRDERIQHFLRILESKGPLAHYRFLECLHREKEHRGHLELYQLLVSETDNTQFDPDHDAVPFPRIRRGPNRIKLLGVLANETYVDRMRKMQRYRYKGKFDKFGKITDKLMKSQCEDERVFAMLAQAVANIMNGQIDKTLQLVDDAQEQCTKIHSDNRIILYGRSLYILSAVYRHEKMYDEAKKYLELAMQTLTDIEPGEDSASLFYHKGTLALDYLAQDNSPYTKEDAEGAFATAIEHAEKDTSGLPLIGMHSRVFSAFLHMGSTHRSPAQSRPSDIDLRSSQSALDGVEESRLPRRTKALYYIALSDMSRWKGELSTASEYAYQAQGIADHHSFTFEKTFAKDRLTSLHRLQDPDSDIETSL